MAHIEIDGVYKRYEDGTLAVENLTIDIVAGEFLCVLGPSGCGKSSTLRMLAGLETVTKGEIRIDGLNVINTPPRDRDIAMVFENYALYPHLNVFNNIAMPLVARRVQRSEIKRQVLAIAETLDIATHLSAKPKHLSGGQRQRVSLARAMIRRPKMFLMDEPLGHLEAYMRVELRREIRRLHEEVGGTTFYITHAQEEAAAISDRIAVMSEGRLQQIGTIRDLIDRPVNRFVAEFVGEPPINMFEGASIDSGELRLAEVSLPIDSTRHASLAAKDSRAHGPLTLGVRPADLTLFPAEDSVVGLPVVVTSVQPMGEWSAVICDGSAGRATAVVAAKDTPSQGTSAKLGFPPARMHLFTESGANLFAGKESIHG